MSDLSNNVGYYGKAPGFPDRNTNPINPLERHIAEGASQSAILELIAAALVWASFQEPDSLSDQETDARLKAEATASRERLLAAIERLS